MLRGRPKLMMGRLYTDINFETVDGRDFSLPLLKLTNAPISNKGERSFYFAFVTSYPAA